MIVSSHEQLVILMILLQVKVACRGSLTIGMVRPEWMLIFGTRSHSYCFIALSFVFYLKYTAFCTLISCVKLLFKLANSVTLLVKRSKETVGTRCFLFKLLCIKHAILVCAR